MTTHTRTLSLATALLLVTSLLVATGFIPRPNAAASITDPRLELPPLQAPGEWFDSQRSIGADGVDYAGALAEAAALGERTAQLDPELAGLGWDLLGPTNIGGRVVDLAVVPGDTDTLWVATASGGVWKSTDAGTTFAPSWPKDVTQALGAMAATADGDLFVGTGEANPGGGSIVYGGTGMYRSTDDGQTWHNVGLNDSGAFGRIVVDPNDGETIYAAASGDLFEPGGDRGLYRSKDNGDTWELLLEGANDTTGAVDVAIHPTDPNRILVAMWDHYRTPEARVYAGEGSGVYLSTDGGESFERIDDVKLPNDPNPDDEYSIADETGRIGVAFAPGDGNRAYAIIANTLDGTHGAWFRSDDAGSSFTELPSPSQLVATNSSYGWWFARIFVDPTDADHLYVAGLELTESRDGGETFLNQSSSLVGVLTGAHQVAIHADQHSMVWSPDVPGLVYLGNDGGVYKSAGNGAPGTWVAAEKQGWTQHYSVDVDEQTAEFVVSGLQDNLCQQHVGSDEASSGAWTKYGLCGDGIVTRVDPEDPQTTYYCSQYGGCGRAIAGAPDLRFRMPTDRYGWLADIQFDPTDSSTIFTAGSSVWRSTNEGNQFTQISGDLSSMPDQLDPNPGYRLRGVVTTLAVSADGNTVWAGTDEGRLWKNTDVSSAANDIGNTTWTLIDDGDASTPAGDGLDLPERTWITSITLDPTDADTAYVAYSGFRQGVEDAKLFVTTDGGATFEDVSGNLPAAPINDVIVVDGQLLVATDVGVFLTRFDLVDDEDEADEAEEADEYEDGETDSDDDGDVISWLRVGDLPAVPVIELRFHQGTSSLTAATFGHGVRRTYLPDAPAGGDDLVSLVGLG